MPLSVEAFDHVVLNVRDVERTASWYERTLGMQRETFTNPEAKDARTALKFGKQKMNLRPITAGKDEWFTADQVAAGSADLCFLTQSSPGEVVAHLSALGVPIELGPVEKHGAQGTLISVYCRDPDGSLIEIASYKP
jgi:catechol 2,3-dioxygenase-like lactoylglutathione lyase family enzyme